MFRKLKLPHFLNAIHGLHGILDFFGCPATAQKDSFYLSDLRKTCLLLWTLLPAALLNVHSFYTSAHILYAMYIIMVSCHVLFEFTVQRLTVEMRLPHTISDPRMFIRPLTGGWTVPHSPHTPL